MGKQKSAAVVVEPNCLLDLDQHVYQRWVPSPAEQTEPRPFDIKEAIKLLRQCLRP